MESYFLFKEQKELLNQLVNLRFTTVKVLLLHFTLRYASSGDIILKKFIL